jgi:hypothetical protein
MMKSKGTDYSCEGSKKLPKAEMGGSKKLPEKVVIGHSPMKKQATFKTGKTG